MERSQLGDRMRSSTALDITRLLHAPLSATPRGIDRVELAYAHHFFEAPRADAAMAIAPTILGVRRFEPLEAIHVVQTVQRLWAETESDDVRYSAVRQWLLTGQRDPALSQSSPVPALDVVRKSAKLLRSFRSLGKPVRSLPPRSIYLNVGHNGLALPGYLRWLGERPDVAPVFMLHDAIPIDHSQYVSPRETKAHIRRIEAATRFASALITNSEASREQIQRHVGRKNILTRALPLPASNSFQKPPEPDPTLADAPYFIIIGAIEPRKNHALLLRLWENLAAGTDPVPKLLIVGAREYVTPELEALLNRNSAQVLHVTGLSTPALSRLLVNARGLLMPSLAEGFGLPIVEALAVGTPVIASDIPAHREAGGSRAVYLQAGNLQAWQAAVVAHSQSRRAVAPARPWTWSDYFAELEDFLATVQSNQPSAGMSE